MAYPLPWSLKAAVASVRAAPPGKTARRVTFKDDDRTFYAECDFGFENVGRTVECKIETREISGKLYHVITG